MSKRKLAVVPSREAPEVIVLTPAMAMDLLERNRHNRPLRQPLVNRIAEQIRAGKWRFNGDTIKISSDGDVLDGQHRLWACVESQAAIEPVLVRGLDPEVFTTIDTIRANRSLADTVALAGQARLRNEVAAALTWLLRWQNGCLPDYKRPEHRLENSDVLAAFEAHPGVLRAVERVRSLRGMIAPGVAAFLFYAFASRNEEAAGRFISLLAMPGGVSVDHPAYRFRTWLDMRRNEEKRNEPEMVIAVGFKAWRAFREGREIKSLIWRKHGKGAEPFPELAE